MKLTQARQYKVGHIIAILHILNLLNAIYFFFGMAKFSFVEWFFFNICSPSVILYLIGFYLKRLTIMIISLPFLLFFGGVGLFVFGWSGTSLYAQIGHILMVLSIIYTLFLVGKNKQWKSISLRAVIGVIIFSIFLPFHQNYIKSHPELLQKLGDKKFKNMMQQKNNN